jgi:hypothetical protein
VYDVVLNSVTDLTNALLGNSPVHIFQHTPRNNGGTCVFYVVTSPTIETVFSMGPVQSAYKRSEFTSQLISGQLRVVDQKLGSQ